MRLIGQQGLFISLIRIIHNRDTTKTLSQTLDMDQVVYVVVI